MSISNGTLFVAQTISAVIAWSKAYILTELIVANIANDIVLIYFLYEIARAINTKASGKSKTLVEYPGENTIAPIFKRTISISHTCLISSLINVPIVLHLSSNNVIAKATPDGSNRYLAP